MLSGCPIGDRGVRLRKTVFAFTPVGNQVVCAGTGDALALPYASAYYFVCPKSFLALPKVAKFREWIFAAATAFPGPPGRDT